MRLEPLIDFLITLPSHDRATLLHILEVSKEALILEKHEEVLYDNLLLAWWKTTKLEEMEE